MNELSILQLLSLSKYFLAYSVKVFPLVSTCQRVLKNGDRCGQCVLVSGVATVEWTYAAIYHLSLSTCVGGPAAGIIAIWEQLTVIPSFCLCESSSSLCTPTGTSSLEMTSRAGTKQLWVCRSSCCISLSARLQLFSWWSGEPSQ